MIFPEVNAVPDDEKIQTLTESPVGASTISRYENAHLHIIKPYKTSENQRRKLLTLEQAKNYL